MLFSNRLLAFPTLTYVIGALAVGCAAEKSPDITDETPEDESCVEVSGPARSPMRRLTPAELDRTLEDLLGTSTGLVTSMLPPEQVGGFSNNVDVRNVGADTVDSYVRLATLVAAQVTEDLSTVLTCEGLFDKYQSIVAGETMETDVGFVDAGHLMLYSAGYAQTTFDIAQTGSYTLTARLQGTVCSGENARWTLVVDEEPISQGFATEQWELYAVDIELASGQHTVQVVFDNDCYFPDTGEDRNLAIDYVELSSESLAVGEPEEFSSCVEIWLGDFLPRAWRHPIEDAEVLNRLVDFHRSAAQQWGQTDAMRMLLEVILQSPRLLYRVEESSLQADPGEVVQLNGYEMASRLSYFLWGTMPDEQLFTAAAAGELDTVEGIEEQALRMLDDHRAKEIIDLFFAEWLQLDHLDEVEKDLDVYPDWNDSIPVSLREETMRFIHQVWAEDSSFETLLTANWTVLDENLARFYEVDAPSTDWGRVFRNPDYYAGILTHGSFLASRARPYASSPIHRGMFIRGSLLCHVINAPDASLEIEIPDPDPNMTTREVLEQHRADPSCAGCHNLIDPPGLAFEHFDGVGKFRSEENGFPIDASSELMGTDVNGMISGAPELAQALVNSTMVHECFSKQWYRFAHGRRESSPDKCAIESAADSFVDQDLDMRALILATVSSPAFRYAVGSN